MLFECDPPGGRRLRRGVNVFRIASRGREMYLVQDSPAAHGDLACKELVLEDRSHREAEEQVLLNLVRLGPRYQDLVGEYVFLRERDHFRIWRRWTLSTIPQGSRAGPAARCPCA
jgi:hypothetical protein